MGGGGQTFLAASYYNKAAIPNFASSSKIDKKIRILFFSKFFKGCHVVLPYLESTPALKNIFQSSAHYFAQSASNSMKIVILDSI